MQERINFHACDVVTIEEDDDDTGASQLRASCVWSIVDVQHTSKCNIETNASMRSRVAFCLLKSTSGWML